MRAVGILVAVSMAVLVAAEPAEAGTLRGYTHRGLNVKLTTDAKGREKVALFNWHIRLCSSGRYSFTDATQVTSKTGKADRSFHTGNPYAIKSRGLRSLVEVQTRGHRVSIYRWKSKFKADVTIRKRGRVVDRCHFPFIRWTASAPRARLVLPGGGDYILGSLSYTYVSPEKTISAAGDRHRVEVHAGPWSLTVAAPPHHALRVQRYARARREPFNGRHPGLDLSGDGRGCNTLKGEFTIKRAKFDKRGVKRLTLSFVQHCEGGDRADRGTLTYRR